MENMEGRTTTLLPYATLVHSTSRQPGFQGQFLLDCRALLELVFCRTPDEKNESQGVREPQVTSDGDALRAWLQYHSLQQSLLRVRLQFGKALSHGPPCMYAITLFRIGARMQHESA